MADTPNFDEFLSSMTFASGDIGCECDECGLPPTIRNAVNEHLLRKRKALEQPSVFDGSKRLYIRQNRELVKREGGFSIWRLHLPVDGGDPIVEYRNNHRILFVKQLSKTSNVLSIGQGIIGSAAEENTRKRVNWEEGASYFLPQSKGIACGWINKKIAVDESKNVTAVGDSTSRQASSDTDTKDVVMYALKISPDALQSMEEEDMPEDTPCWVKKSYELFRQCLAKNGVQEDTSDAGSTAIEGIPLSDEESLAMNLIVELAQ